MNGYANAVLAGQSYRPDDPVDAETAAKPDSLTSRGDIGSELAKLNQGIVRLIMIPSPLQAGRS